MKTYLFNMEKCGHNIELAYNHAKNIEDWEEFEKVQDIYLTLLSCQTGKYSEVTWDVFQKATEISAGAVEYRARANANRVA